MAGQNLKKILLVLTVVILLVTMKQLELMTNIKERVMHKRWAVENTERGLTPRELFKVVHLDLKGAPPKMKFLLRVLPLAKEAGAGAILVEYEDMFPFYGALKNVSAKNAYTREEVKTLVEATEALGMQVIPLVQTFGHLEYILKLEEFQNLRELETFPQEICPSNKEAVDLVKEVIRQCMEAHPNARYIHIGCDEVRHVGACPRCSRNSPKNLFAAHVVKVAQHVRAEFPGVTPLIWDDMLRRWTYHEMAESGLASAVEPVVWVYGNNIFTLVPPFVWNIYRRTFPRVWVASAYKGAFGETETLPDLNRHLENHLSWLEVVSKEEKEGRVEVPGIFLTGWSRYDHFAVLCELLPIGIPSLVLGLTFLQPMFGGRVTEGFSRWLRLLRCPDDFLPSRTQNESFFRENLGHCSFPGNDLYSGMIRFQGVKTRVEEATRRAESGAWTSRYNIENNFTSPWRILEMFPEEGFAGEVLRKNVVDWKSGFVPLLEKYFDEHTVKEWEEQNVKPLEVKLERIQRNFQDLIKRKTWPRRPIR